MKKKTNIIILGISIFTLLCVAAAVTGKYVVAPMIVRDRIHERLDEIWAGDIFIGEVHFSYFRPIFISQLQLLDEQSRAVVDIGTLRLGLGKWMQLRPDAVEYDIGNLVLSLRATNGEIEKPPIIKIEEEDQDLPAIRKVTVQQAKLSLKVTEGKTLEFGNVYLSAIRKGRSWEILSNRLSPDKASNYNLTGNMDWDGDNWVSHVFLQFDQWIVEEDARILSQALKALRGATVAGHFKGELDLTGDLTQPETWLANGYINVDDGLAIYRDHVFGEQLSGYVELDDQIVTVDDVAGKLCNGPMHAAMQFRIEQAKIQGFDLWMEARDLNLSECADVFPQLEQLRNGTVHGEIQMSLPGSQLDDLEGSGVLVLSGADLRLIKLVSNIFSAVGLKALDPLAASNAMVDFEVNGPVVTLQDARVANKVSAVRVQPGSTIDMATKQVDMLVIAVPVDALDQTVRKIPFSEILMNFKDKLARLRVGGSLDKPTIRKEPIKDLAAGTFGLLGDVISIPGNIIDAFSDGKKQERKAAKEKQKNQKEGRIY